MSRASNSDQEHIAARTAKLADAYNKKDVETALTMFVDTGLGYSDYGVNALSMTKSAFATFLHYIFDSLEHLSLKTIGVNGTKDFTAWQWEWEFVKKAGGKSGFEDLDKGAEGQMLRMRGCSITWWNEEDKVVKNCDYTCFV
ncbi:hypothetical protein L207DRAFT_613409 [Hyaloscypha variabilis F]|uniref:SnoaL-like domain-containing protein n=1 Tax=Hyaloscypha variabilis (strain UAMH 11265 / GT02V1 / F) TaxID=1149755 RepID=A0A2J6S7H3_HYAVF|nr:hypothetical protein L207DRAFT_613409 [Hyaloscypha variabilis F]